ncbi:MULTISPECIES: translocation/assembly module TamB [unclassified Leptolyngbya]|uniref:translocation/assembly module TamB domain-containing protein n=1 Tax=unclassified Leptolyngbya TaxID=2650499 RepID=UPI0016873DBF|nr:MULTISPECIES: translocation/assembly module TamB [unclassified Leptolyngbya]MBD1912138.1 translocation/assembly module TamB domain-containing protein [Leptolyngbya sp. FACHB-8]MBD2155029.1 translocation/assembly module TamB domain-containing protein [Leptolyngbya sp. FACHB-16]
MTNSPNGEQPPEQEHVPAGRRSRRRRLWRRVGLGIGATLLLGGAGGGLWLYLFVTRDLAPTVAKQLANLVNRPVEIEDVESFSLTGVTFGASTLPATDTDLDQIDINQIVATYDLWEILWTRRVGLDVTLVNPRGVIDQTPDGKWIVTKFGRTEEEEEDEKAGPFKVELDNLKVRNGELTLLPSPTVQQEIGKPNVGKSLGARPEVNFSDVNGDLSLQDDNNVLTFDVRMTPRTGGRARLSGRLLLEEELYSFTLRSRNLAAADVSSLIAIPVTLDAGLLTTNLTVLVEENTLRSLDGFVRVRQGRAVVQDVPQPIQNVQANARFRGQRIVIQNSTFEYGEIPVALRGDIHLERGYDLVAEAKNVPFGTIQRTVGFDVPIPIAGNFDVAATLGGDIDDPDVAGRVQTNGPARVDRVTLNSASTTFALDVDEDGSILNLPEVRANVATGGSLQGGGSVTLGDAGQIALNFAVRNVASDAIAQSYGANLPNRLRLGITDADVRVSGPLQRVQTQIQARSRGGTYPLQGEVLIAGGNIGFRNVRAQVAGGTVTGTGAIANNRLEAAVRVNNVSLSEFSPQVQGVLNTDLRVAGNLRDLGPGSVRAEGNVRLTQGVPYLQGPLNASFAWLGDRLQINQATAPGFSASGTVFTSLSGSPQISRLDVGLQLRDYNLTQLQAFLPDQVQLAGRGTFDGRVTGTPQSPSVEGRLQTRDLVVNRLAFDSVLSGPIAFTRNRGGRIDLVGAQDRIFAELNSRNRPTEFLIRRGETVAQGTTEGDRLQAQVVNFPVAFLNLPPVATLGTPRGTLTAGNFTVNLNTLAASGDIQVADPAVGYVSGDRLSTRFRYEEGVLALQNGELLLGDSRFLVGGSVETRGDRTVRVQVAADQGYVQDVLTALQWYEFGDIGRGFGAPNFAAAEDVTTVAVGNPEDSLLNQLRRLAEIQALEDIEEQEAAQGIQLPDLRDLSGVFTGVVSVNGSLAEGLNTEFDVNGVDWVWGEYQADQVIAQGSFSDGAVTLLPLRVQANEDAYIDISGQFGGESQDGQIQISNIPAEGVRDLLNVPVDVTGDLDANVLIGGSLDNPLARGTILLDRGTFNQKALDRARTSFSYTDARLSFIGEAAIPDTNPLRVEGSIPYQLPFMAVEPASDNITLNARVEDDGLELLSLFTNQVQWEGGEGVVDLNVTGTLYEPQIVGTATFTNGIVSALALPEPLTNVNGNVTFDRRLIRVNGLQGQFEQGFVTAQGLWPIFNEYDLPESTELEASNPLAVTLSDVVLNFKGLYRGGVDGQVELLGTAFAPIVTGDIELSSGQVELASNRGGGAAAPTQEPYQSGPTRPPRLEDLKITLGDRLRITQNPILNFVARGDLLIDGPIGNLRPEGTIRLRSGQVNLFTTQFGLAGGYENIARFYPNRGLDPFLDVRLVTSVPELQRVPAPSTSPFGTAEIAETLATDIGAVGTVRVEARVEGYASQLSENLELSSSPARTQSEIISLLGGNVVASLAEGDGSLAIANLASSALLTQLQNQLTRALGITEFRLYPTILPEDETARGSSTGTLELASELGVDITGQFSASVLAILTADAPVQFNLRYRLTDQLLLRGYVDTEGGQGAILEFETRF